MTMTVPQTSILTSQDVGIPGALADFQSASDAVVDSAVNADVVDLAFGTFVVQGTADQDAKLPAAATDKLKGLVVHGHDYERLTQLASDGIKPGTTFGLLREGRAWVLPTVDMTPASPVHVQMVAEAGHAAGTIRDAASVGKTLDCTAFMQVIQGATLASGNPVKLEVDMTNVKLATAD